MDRRTDGRTDPGGEEENNPIRRYTRNQSTQQRDKGTVKRSFRGPGDRKSQRHALSRRVASFPIAMCRPRHQHLSVPVQYERAPPPPPSCVSRHCQEPPVTNDLFFFAPSSFSLRIRNSYDEDGPMRSAHLKKCWINLGHERKQWTWSSQLLKMMDDGHFSSSPNIEEKKERKENFSDAPHSID